MSATITQAVEARIATLAVQECKRKEDRLVRLDEAIKAEICKGRMKLQMADVPQWMYEALRDAGYTVHHLSDGYEIRWDKIDGADDDYIRP